MPLLAGFNSGEIRSLTFSPPSLPRARPTTKPPSATAIGDLADEFLRLYPSTNMRGEHPGHHARRPLRLDGASGWSRKQTALGQPAFLYFFDHGYPAADAAGLHGFHASELPFVFGTFDGTPPLWPKIPDNAAGERSSPTR